MELGLPAVAGGALGVGLLGAIWNKLSFYWSRVWSPLFLHVRLRGNIVLALRWYMVRHCKYCSLTTLIIASSDEYIRKLKKRRLVGMECMPEESTIWWLGYRPFVMVGGDFNCCELIFIRGIIDPKLFFLAAIKEWTERVDQSVPTVRWNTSRFFVKRVMGKLGRGFSGFQGNQPQDTAMAVKTEPGPGSPRAENNFGGVPEKEFTYPMGYTRDELGQPGELMTMDMLSMNADMEAALEEAKRWRASETWFKERGVPWRRGVLLHGKPGTGKTAYCRALGQLLGMPIFSFDLATMSNQDFMAAWDDAKYYTPCIILLEDLDGIFHGRKNITCTGMEAGLSFDCLLNAIDGAGNADGTFVIVTTNDISKIDTAIGIPRQVDSDMSTRPGRMDRLVHFTSLDVAGREKMANRILGDFPKEQWAYLLQLDESALDSGAQFQERCCRLALDLFWNDKQKKEVV